MGTTSTPVGSFADAEPAVESEPGGWAAVISLALGSFALVLSEFLPIGLLPAISADFGVGIGTAGLLVVVTGLAAAAAAPLVTVLSSRIDRRTTLWALTLSLVIANISGALAQNFAMLLAARVLLGIAAGGFWAVGAGLGSRLVAPGSVIRATSLITAGISIATVLSLPLSAWVSDASSWRTAFLIGAAFSVVALLAQLALLPRIPAREGVQWSSLRVLLTAPRARQVLVVSMFVFLAQFTAYTYVAEYLGRLVDLDPPTITLGLLIMGIAGVFGNSIASVTLARSLPATVAAMQVLLIVSVVSLPLLAWSLPGVIVLLVLWGLVWGALPLGMQTWMLQASPSATEGSLALFVTTVQFAIAAGSVVGGIAVSTLGVTFDFFLAGGIAAVGVVVFLSFNARRPIGARDRV